jgi:putative aldouronate transport system permease protein
MYGVQLAFKDFVAVKGIAGSPFAQPLFKHFIRFFNSYLSKMTIKNTIFLSLYELIVGFPMPILLALMLNQVEVHRFKKFTQTITYAPHFLSEVVVVGMMLVFLSPRSGFINAIITAFGFESVNFMMEPSYFRDIYVISGIWQHAGWAAIIYLSVLSSVDPALHEAAQVDGANKFQRVLHIDLPSIIPTAVIMLIMRSGRIMNLGFEKAFLMQNSVNIDASEIISTYVYKVGLINMQFGFSTAVNLFNSLCNCILLLIVNGAAKRFGDNSLW